MTSRKKYAILPGTEEWASYNTRVFAIENPFTEIPSQTRLNVSDKKNGSFEGEKVGTFDQTLDTVAGRERIKKTQQSLGKPSGREDVKKIIQDKAEKALAERLCHYLNYIQDVFPAKPIILDIPYEFIQKYNRPNPEFEWSKLLYEQGKKGNIDFDEAKFVAVALKCANNNVQQKKEAVAMALEGKSQEEQEAFVKEMLDNHLLSSDDIQGLLQ